MIGRHATLLVWALLGAGLVGLQVVALLCGGRAGGLGAAVGRITAGRLGRSVSVLAWMWLGWHAFAR